MHTWITAHQRKVLGIVSRPKYTMQSPVSPHSFICILVPITAVFILYPPYSKEKLANNGVILDHCYNNGPIWNHH
jgi:hypothetical protein